MRRISIQTKEIEPDKYLGNYANASDVSTVIDEDVIIEVDGEVVLAYVSDIGEDIRELREMLSEHKFGVQQRASSKKAFYSASAGFGYQPRLPLRTVTQNCRIASLVRSNKDLHSLLVSWTNAVTRVYKELAPDAAKHHTDQTEENILEEYRLPRSMFTSGIVNKSNQLPYHYDSGNFVGAWSAMLGLSQGVSGGFLNIPEYDIALKISDGSLSFFDGQSRLHGVTPFTRNTPAADRYTIVWYSLRKLWDCLPYREELAHANQRMTEQNRIKSQKGKDK